MLPQRVDAVNFVRAETDRYFDDLIARSGGVNRWHHTREPAPIDKQVVVRMNRDTLYSSAILDVSQGATVSMPDASGRIRPRWSLTRTTTSTTCSTARASTGSKPRCSRLRMLR